jgi:hypothetical protein
MKKKSLSELGQTSVEYIFLLAMIATIVIGIGKKISARMLPPNGEDCPVDPGPNDPYFCLLLKQFNQGGGLDKAGRYRYFSLRR